MVSGKIHGSPPPPPHFIPSHLAFLIEHQHMHQTKWNERAKREKKEKIEIAWIFVLFEHKRILIRSDGWRTTCGNCPCPCESMNNVMYFRRGSSMGCTRFCARLWNVVATSDQPHIRVEHPRNDRLAHLKRKEMNAIRLRIDKSLNHTAAATTPLHIEIDWMIYSSQITNRKRKKKNNIKLDRL